ncbi:MAG: SGNH/GDSL hydrolase family protein [Sphingobacteriaceae bacterium]|nr:SGNH/GDSL hydrolase family protein [Sphingobacteriaceae bacterium]
MPIKEVIKYVPLVDSYTICTGATEAESWPSILTKHLNEKGLKTELLFNPSKNGYTTQNLIDIELPKLDKSDCNFATILIGVNDWVREVTKEDFHSNLNYIIDHVAKKIDKKRIVLITIPDFGVTPQGSLFGGGRDISKGISGFNDIIKAEAKKRDIVILDIFKISQLMKGRTDLVAVDGLHPSAKEYAEWEKLILPVAQKLLSE